jgi:hypothetical protein
MQFNIIIQKYICGPKQLVRPVFTEYQLLISAQNFIKYISKMHINIILQKLSVYHKRFFA